MVDGRVDGRVEGKVALVTGGAGGIGRATALAFAEAGARAVMIADLKDDDAAETVAMVESLGAVALYQRTDVTDEEEVAELIAATVDDFGALDCAFNNAGINDTMTPFHELSLEGWDKMIAINLTSVFLCMKYELAHMSANGGGSIVNTSSGAGVVGFAGLPHYVAAKHGVLGLTKTAAQEYVRQGVRVNAVLPGTTDTPMIRSFIGEDEGMAKMMAKSNPGGRFIEPEEIAQTVLWLSSDAANRVNGQSIIVDDGGISR